MPPRNLVAGPDIRTQYEARLAARRRLAERLDRQESLVAGGRLVCFVAGAVALVAALRGQTSPLWAASALVAFVALVVRHRGLRDASALARGSIDFYTRGLARLDDAWVGTGTSGDRFHDARHPYVDDLDLFGAGSLFELLCTCRTRVGEDRLAAWLGAAADPDEVVARQGAAREIGWALDLREDLSRLGDDARAEVHDQPLVAWATAPGERLLASRLLRGVTAIAGGAAGIALAAWMGGAGPLPFLATICAALPLHLALHARAMRVVRAVDTPARSLGLAATLLRRFGTEAFRDPTLLALQRALAGDDEGPVRAIRRLGRLVDLLDAQRNPLFAPFALALLWPAQIAFAIEHWRARHGARIAAWLAALGDVEALVAVGTYTVEHPDDALPEIGQGTAAFQAEALGHPLIPAARCVRNDVRLDAKTRILVVSGSNMSGKSTLLRAVGVNAVLAQLGAPVRARALRMTPLAVGASIRTLDSLQDGRSRFYAEIERLRLLVGRAEGPRPLLFLLDEILHGTNSHDRRVGAEAVLRGLARRGAVGLVTTHDLALAVIADDPALGARNVHFADRLEHDRMVFDYRMQPGVVTHSNALALMRAVGLEV